MTWSACRTLEKGQKFYLSQFPYFYDILTEVLLLGRAQGSIFSCFGSPSISSLPTCGVRNAGSQNGRKTGPVGYRTINQGLSSYTHNTWFTISFQSAAPETFSTLAMTVVAHRVHVTINTFVSWKKEKNRAKKREAILTMKVLLWWNFYTLNF